jgi:hypothetical protein
MSLPATSLHLFPDVGDGERSGSLLVHNLSKAGLALNNAIGDVHLAAQCRQPNNDFDRVDVVGNDHEGSLLLLNKGGNVVDATLNKERTLALGGSSLSLLGLGSSLKTVLLLLLGLRAVFGENFEQLSSCQDHQDQRAERVSKLKTTDQSHSANGSPNPNVHRTHQCSCQQSE